MMNGDSTSHAPNGASHHDEKEAENVDDEELIDDDDDEDTDANPLVKQMTQTQVMEMVCLFFLSFIYI